MTIVAGVDFGTTSVRVSIFHSERGRLGIGTAAYPVLRRPDDANFATQRPDDQALALQQAFAAAIAAAGVPGKSIAALAVDTTGSTVIPVDAGLRPLDDYALWCDHRAWREAAEITASARARKLAALDWCGGAYSSEWGFSKVLHWLREHPERRGEFQTAVEHCDLIVAQLTGVRDPTRLRRSVCAMGHKWLWNRSLGGLPSDEFLSTVDPLLTGLRQRLDGEYLTSDQIAGVLAEGWAQRLGLQAGIPIPVGALDAHWDALGAGCRLGDVVNVIGTSTCVMALSTTPRLIPGVAGVVHGSIHPDLVGIEAGLSATGDLFDAIARRSNTPLAALAAAIEGHRAGQTGLLRLAWDNGDRCVLANPQLRGITVGWQLNHTAADELFAAIEGTGFHTRIIFERMREHGVPIDRVIHCGGIPQRNATLNRIYASILGKPILVPTTDTTSLGAAIFAFLAAGAFRTVEEAQAALAPTYRAIEPVREDVSVYEDLCGRFRELYFMLGRGASERDEPGRRA
jgi:L-ribulokinase